MKKTQNKKMKLKKIIQIALTAVIGTTLYFNSPANAKNSEQYKELINKFRNQQKLEKPLKQNFDNKDYTDLEALYIKKLIEIYIRQNGTSVINKIIKYYDGNPKKTLDALIYLDQYNDLIDGKEICDGMVFRANDAQLQHLYEKLENYDLIIADNYNSSYGEEYFKRLASINELEKQCKTISKSQFYKELANYKFIFVGEMHKSKAHIKIELGIIKNLAKKGINIFLEHFCPGEQPVLDAYFNNKISDKGLIDKLDFDPWRNEIFLAHKHLFNFIRDLNKKGYGINVFGIEENHVGNYVWSGDDFYFRDKSMAANISKNYSGRQSIVILGRAHMTLASRIPSKVGQLTGENYCTITQYTKTTQDTIDNEIKKAKGKSNYSAAEHGLDKASLERTLKENQFHIHGDKIYFLEQGVCN